MHKSLLSPSSPAWSYELSTPNTQSSSSSPRPSNVLSSSDDAANVVCSDQSTSQTNPEAPSGMSSADSTIPDTIPSVNSPPVINLGCFWTYFT